MFTLIQEINEDNTGKLNYAEAKAGEDGSGEMVRPTGCFPVPWSEAPSSRDPLGTQASPRSPWLIVGNLRLWVSAERGV